MRGDARLTDIPIVMITSRVGEKHRARAIEIGVNDYLGKPYQENQLLDAIEPLVEARRRKVVPPRVASPVHERTVHEYVSPTSSTACWCRWRRSG